MERIPDAVYTKELREEAVRMIMKSGLKAQEVARRLSIPKSTICLPGKGSQRMNPCKGVHLVEVI